MKISALFLVLFCFAESLWSQDSQVKFSAVEIATKSKLPAGPLLRSVEDFAQWDIAFTYPDDKQRKDKGPDPSFGARPRKSTTIKTGKIVHEMLTTDDRRLTDVWFDGLHQYYKLGNNPIWFETTSDAIASASVSSYDKPLPQSGFRDLEVVRDINYAGTIAYGKGKCLIFTPGGDKKLDLSDPDLASKRMEGLDTIAYIDDDTRLPIAVRMHNILRTYRFDPPPVDTQTFPAELTAQLNKGQEGRARLQMPAARPN